MHDLRRINSGLAHMHWSSSRGPREGAHMHDQLQCTSRLCNRVTALIQNLTREQQRQSRSRRCRRRPKFTTQHNLRSSPWYCAGTTRYSKWNCWSGSRGHRGRRCTITRMRCRSDSSVGSSATAEKHCHRRPRFAA